MSMSERRGSLRYKLQTPMAFHRMGLLFDGECIVRSIDMSTGGARFATGVRVTVGERIELSVLVPKQITGDKAKYRRFTGRVAHVDTRNLNGYARVGVQWLYYEAAAPMPRSADAA
jgi:PilZ domain-containing protein